VISVLIVNRNGEQWIEGCLDSFSDEPRDQIQIIVVDNDSTDRSAEIIERRFPHVALMPMGRNAGFAVANNLAAANAEGDALLLLNNDAWLEPGCLSRLRERLESDERLGLVAPKIVRPDGRSQFVWAPDRSLLGEAVQRLRNPFEGRALNHGLGEQLLRAVFGQGWYTAACVLLRRQAFEGIGGFDPSYFLYFEDADLCLRLRAAGWRLRWEPEATAVHAGGGRSLDDEAEAHYRRSQLYYYYRHRPRWELAALKLKLGLRYGSERLDRWLENVAEAAQRRRPMPE